MKLFYSDFGTKETVDCMINGENFTAFAACGDNNIHHVDLEYGKVKHAFSGHTDFIHSMSLVYVTTIFLFCMKHILNHLCFICISGNQLSSASEDGTVCIWDTRKSKPVHVITPHLESKLNRPHLGKWVGAVAMNEDWLVSLFKDEQN